MTLDDINSYTELQDLKHYGENDLATPPPTPPGFTESGANTIDLVEEYLQNQDAKPVFVMSHDDGDGGLWYEVYFWFEATPPNE